MPSLIDLGRFHVIKDPYKTHLINRTFIKVQQVQSMDMFTSLFNLFYFGYRHFNEFMLSISPYISGFPHRHWDNRRITLVPVE